MIQEITVQALNPERFIREKVHEIGDAVGDGLAINALSGGVDSSTVTMLGHRALGERLKTVFINNGLMREGESEQVVSLFQKLGVKVTVVDARREFFAALKGITDPEEKREAITQTFYRNVFGRIVKESGAKSLLQGTILTDVDETVAGIKRQHNVFAQLGIDPQEAFGYLGGRPASPQQSQRMPALTFPRSRSTVYALPHFAHIQLPLSEQDKHVVHNTTSPSRGLSGSIPYPLCGFHLGFGLESAFPGVKERLLEGDHLMPGMLVAVDGKRARRGLLEPLGEQSEVRFLLAVAGG